GYGWVGAAEVACDAPAGFLADGSDCDDFDPANFPGADERCDGVDNNCDALVDGADAVDQPTWYRDLDGDGYGSTSSTTSCDAPPDYTAQPGDCNDLDAGISPLASEVCDNGIDDDCNSLVDECGGVDNGPNVYPIGDLTV